MNHLSLSLITIAVLSSTAFGMDEAENFTEMFSKSRVSGQARSIYQTNSNLTYLDGTNGSSRTGTVGGKIQFATRTFKGFDAVTTAYGTLKAHGDRNKVDGDYLNNGKANANYALIGQAFARYTNGENFIQVGRFELDTPLLNSDDVRMIPNLFQGVYASIAPAENITFQAGYINRMAGWENGGDNAKFQNIGTLIDGMAVLDTYSAGKSAVTFAGLSYGGEESPFSVRLFDYMTNNVMNEIYADMGGNAGIVNVQAQYLRSMSDKKLKDYLNNNAIADTMIDSTVWGASATITIKDANLGFSIAYNQSVKKVGTLNSGGTPDFFGDANAPFFTSMDILTAHQLGGVKAYKAELTYDPSETLTLALAHGVFVKDDRFKNHETDLGVGYTFKENMALEGMVSKVSQTDTVGVETTNNRARIAVKIGF